ncbi:MAG: GNAT family N-acetyltransferase, partial [Thermoanaerobaculia bacterium]
MIQSGPSEIGDASIRLREVTQEDAPNLYRWRMDPSSRGMFLNTEKVPYKTHVAFVMRYFQPGNTDRWFVIETAGRPVGAIALYAFSADATQAKWGRLVVAPEERTKGYGSRGLALLIEHARQIGVKRLTCEVLVGNAAAEHLYARAGFVE